MTPSLLLHVLQAPADCGRLGLSEWDLLVRQARAAQLLARLGLAVEDSGAWAQVPDAPRRHLLAAREQVARQRQAVRWEVLQLTKALSPFAIPLVLLKGAAYEVADLPPALSRIYSDIDLLVARAQLPSAEVALMMGGWVSRPDSAYDERYYRQWMHEVPPMLHLGRQSIVDLHHNLVPPTAAVRPDAESLLAAIQSSPQRPGVFTLALHDMILHSAVHLFYDGEFDHALRDLLDIGDLLTAAELDAGGWQALVDRAVSLDLARPLFYALRYVSRLLGQQVPTKVRDALRSAGPRYPQLALMDALFLRGLQPQHASCDDTGSAAARFALYVRGHAVRMPMRLLLPHLARKSWMRDAPEANTP